MLACLDLWGHQRRLWPLLAASLLACSSSHKLPDRTQDTDDDSSEAPSDDDTNGPTAEDDAVEADDDSSGDDAADDARATGEEAGASSATGDAGLDAGLMDASKEPTMEAEAGPDASLDANTPETGAPQEAASSAGSLIDEPLAAFPERFSEIGLYSVPGDFQQTHQRALNYAPRNPLWSNGGVKQRYLVLPQGAQIDISEREAWEFPVGTLLFKSFFFRKQEQGELRAVETRILRRADEQWDFVAYVWNDAGTEAERSDMALPIAVEVLGPNSERFDHMVPSGRQCGRCHNAGLSHVLGFSELQLNDWDTAEGQTRLEAVAEAGLLSQPLPEQPLRVEFDDPQTQQVIAYMQGNCVHCHNGQDSELNAFDMRPDVALANLIDAPTQSNASASGIRVVPGDPASSIVFLAFSGETDNPEVQSMPSVGVQLRDAEAIELFRSWILSLE